MEKRTKNKSNDSLDNQLQSIASIFSKGIKQGKTSEVKKEKDSVSFKEFFVSSIEIFRSSNLNIQNLYNQSQQYVSLSQALAQLTEQSKFLIEQHQQNINTIIIAMQKINPDDNELLEQKYLEINIEKEIMQNIAESTFNGITSIQNNIKALQHLSNSAYLILKQVNNKKNIINDMYHMILNKQNKEFNTKDIKYLHDNSNSCSSQCNGTARTIQMNIEMLQALFQRCVMITNQVRDKIDNIMTLQ